MNEFYPQVNGSTAFLNTTEKDTIDIVALIQVGGHKQINKH